MSHIREHLENRIKALKEDIERHKQHLELIKRFPNPEPADHEQEIAEYERRRDMDQRMLDERFKALALLQAGV